MPQQIGLLSLSLGTVYWSTDYVETQLPLAERETIPLDELYSGQPFVMSRQLHLKFSASLSEKHANKLGPEHCCCLLFCCEARGVVLVGQIVLQSVILHIAVEVLFFYCIQETQYSWPFVTVVCTLAPSTCAGHFQEEQACVVEDVFLGSMECL